VYPWVNAHAYINGETVIDASDATTWLCILNHTSAAAPTTFAQDRAANPEYWTRLLTGFAPRGQWMRSTQYFPYDLAYDESQGIMALCITKHISTATGIIVDDKEYWAFLLDMSNADMAMASAVGYSNVVSGIPHTNVQGALDFLEVQIKNLDTININQGASIAALQTTVGGHTNQLAVVEARVTNTETKNTQQDQVDASLQQQITSLGSQIQAIPPQFPSGTVMCFFQQLPPPSWNLINGWSNRAIRIMDGNGGGGTAGGAVGWSTVFDGQPNTAGHVLTEGQMPSHVHGDIPNPVPYTSGGFVNVPLTNPVYVTGAKNTAAAGGNQAHSHPIEMRIAWIGVCIGQKA
jgi:hypothetical protein